MAAVIKLDPDGKVILRNGLPSCTCCSSGTCCDFEVLEIGVFLVAGLGTTGYFTVKNNCASEITVTGYTGFGSADSMDLGAVAPGASGNFLIYYEPFGGVGGGFYGQPFTLTTAECGTSPTYYWPSGDTGNPSWM